MLYHYSRKHFAAFIFPMMLLLGSCEKFEYSPNEVRLEEKEKDLTRKNIERIDALKLHEKPSFKFAVISDTQRFYDDLEAAVDAIKKRPDIEFVILTGDITDFGITKEFKWIHQRMEALGIPYLTVIGNHDCVGNGKEIYKAMYGPYDYVMNIGRNRFVFINTNSREFDEVVPDLNFYANAFRNPEAYDQAYVFSHIPPYDMDFNSTLEDDFVRISRENKVKVSIHGHKHGYEAPVKRYNDEVEYLIVGSVENRGFEEIVVAPGQEPVLNRIAF